MKKELLCTIGPASFDERTIQRLEELGVSLFRINLSHTPLEDLRRCIGAIRKWSSTPICLDTEGAQIRTGHFIDNRTALRENSVVRVHLQAVPGDAKDFNLYPRNIVRRLAIGDFLSIDFNSVLVQVIDTADGGDTAVLRVISGGIVGRNKAVTLQRAIDLPPLTEKDRAALAIGVEEGIRHVALSFANRGADVDTVRAIVGSETFVISKIECVNGLTHLREIVTRSDAILIDRGDLSREVPIEQIPRVQKQIIRVAHEGAKKVYVATNLLESMVTSATPTRAEVNDIYNTLLDGADGLVLAAETAIGDYPTRCAGMVVKLIREVEKPTDSVSRLPTEPISLLVEPHGGRLVDRVAEPEERRRASDLPQIVVADTDLMNCEQIAHGTYSPLDGFMDRETLESVLDRNRLPDGTVWTMPMLLAVGPNDARRVSNGDRIALASSTGTIHATLEVAAIFTCDRVRLAKRWFGTDSPAHPGVARLLGGGDHFLAGRIALIEELPSEYRHFELTPAQTRFIFSHKGWTKIVGFHTRNAPHRAHEFIQLDALERSGADGLYISPVIGPKKVHDFLPGPIMRSYQLMLDFGYLPRGRVVLGGFPTYSRYAGPREAVFTALCRKNLGCSHFIVGRDHTGVGDFYPPEANRRIFEALGDIGINVIFFDTVGYDPQAQCYREAASTEGMRFISGTEVRNQLRKGGDLPGWFMREVVQDMLRAEIGAGRSVFVE